MTFYPSFNLNRNVGGKIEKMNNENDNHIVLVNKIEEANKM